MNNTAQCPWKTNLYQSLLVTVVNDVRSLWFSRNYSGVIMCCSDSDVDWISGALCSCLLPESLQVTAVKQLPEYHECIGGCSLNQCSHFLVLAALLFVPFIGESFVRQMSMVWLMVLSTCRGRWGGIILNRQSSRPY